MLYYYLTATGALLLIYAVWIISTVVKWYKLPGIQHGDVRHDYTYCIVIPARNESHNIITLLESITLSITAQNVEIIVIDDHSTDETYSLCEKFFLHNPIGKILSLKDFTENEQVIHSYKKKAIDIAVRHTNADWIIQTDADCIVPKEWITIIENAAEQNNIEYFTGPVRLISKNITASSYLFHAFQALDFMTMQGITMAGFYKSRGLMSNGANLGYTRKLFQEVNGFENIDQVASGDDMLLLDKIKDQTSAQPIFIKNPLGIVDTEIVYSIKALWHQRIRWGSKSRYYKDNRLKRQLGLVYIMNLMIFLLPLLSLFDISSMKWTFLLIFIKVLIELVLVIPMAIFFRQKQFLPLFPILQPFHILYVVSVGVLSMIGQYQWKNRILR